MKRFIVTVLVFFFIILSFPAIVAAERRALLIGIDVYQYNSEFISISGKPEGITLHGCKNDLEAIKSILEGSLGFRAAEIRTLTDCEATKERILSEIDSWLVAGTKPGDVVFLFYSGHGSFIKDRNGDESDNLDEALCPTDVRPDGSNLLIDDDIGERFSRLRGRTVVAIFDSCHSGTAVRDAFELSEGKDYEFRVFPPLVSEDDRLLSFERPVGDTFMDKSFESYTIFLSACAPEETAAELKTIRMGALTYAITEGIRGNKADDNRNGVVSFDELLRFVTQFIHSELGITKQNPRIEGAMALKAKGIRDICNPVPEDEIEDFGDEQKPRPFKVELWVTEVGKSRFFVGDVLTFNIKSSRDGYLYLMDVQDGERVVLLFPNAYSRDNRIMAGETITVPDTKTFDIKALAPGRDVVLAVVTTAPYEDAAGLIKPSLDAFKTLSETEKREAMGMLWDLGSRPLAVKPTTPEAGFEWSYGKMEIEVVR